MCYVSPTLLFNVITSLNTDWPTQLLISYYIYIYMYIFNQNYNTSDSYLGSIMLISLCTRQAYRLYVKAQTDL